VDDVVVEVSVRRLDDAEVLFSGAAGTVDVRHPAAAAAASVDEVTQLTVFFKHLRIATTTTT